MCLLLLSCQSVIRGIDYSAPFLRSLQVMSLQMKPALVLDPAGFGNSTSTEKSAKRLGTPPFRLDFYCWKSSRIESPTDDWFEIVDSLINREERVMDGNYTLTLKIRIRIDDTIVFLDVYQLMSIWRTSKRPTKHRYQRLLSLL